MLYLSHAYKGSKCLQPQKQELALELGLCSTSSADTNDRGGWPSPVSVSFSGKWKQDQPNSLNSDQGVRVIVCEGSGTG